MSDSPKTTWLDRRKKRLLTISASQVETFDRCPRAWWLSQVRGFKTFSSESQVFGTVLAAVAERYLLADDCGRDPKTGDAVDLYPHEWYIAKSRYPGQPPDGEIGISDQNLVKTLVKAAIDGGVLERKPGRKPESEFRRTVSKTPECTTCKGGRPVLGTDGKPIPCPECNGDGTGMHVQIVGFMDVAYADSVEDHKTTKSMKYAKSPKALQDNAQMLIYAKEIIARADADSTLWPEGRPLSQVTVRHNIFCKDPDDLRVKYVEAIVTRDRINQYWSHIQEDAALMVELRKRVDVWHECPEPNNYAKATACNAYGGCPFRELCAGRISEKGFEAWLDERAKQSRISVDKSVVVPVTPIVTTPPPVMTAQLMESIKMIGDLKDKLLKKPTVTPSTVATIPINPVPAPATSAPATSAPVQGPGITPPAAPVEQPAADEYPPPPWANVECKACRGSGFNTRGEPCKICDLHAAKNGKKPSSLYDLDPQGDGIVVWIDKADTDNNGICKLPGSTPAAEVKVESRVDVTPAQAKKPKAAKTEQISTPITEAEPVVEKTTATPAANAAPAATVDVVSVPAPVAQTEAKPAAVLPPAPQEAPAVSSESGEEGDEMITPNPAPAPAGEKRGRGRPLSGYTLLVNCVPIKFTSKVFYLHDVLKSLGERMVVEAKKTKPEIQSIADIDVFQRRDAFVRFAPEICEEFGSGFVVALGIGSSASDAKALLDAIRPYAGREVLAA